MSDAIGERLEWMQTVLDRAQEGERMLDERSQEFVDQLRERVDQYQDRTMISVAQINWLNRIDQQLENAGY